MGKGGGAQNTQSQLVQSQENLMNTAASESQELFSLGLPGLQTAESYYNQLASGNQKQIFNAIAPAVGQINTASQSAATNIANTLPRGGVEQMAQANLQQQRAGQIGNLATQAYTGSFPALASLSEGTLGLSNNSTSNAVSASSAAGQSNAALMQAQAAGKGSTLGFAGSLASAGGQLGSAAKDAAAFAA
jgi:hypothetical protein